MSSRKNNKHLLALLDKLNRIPVTSSFNGNVTSLDLDTSAIDAQMLSLLLKDDAQSSSFSSFHEKEPSIYRELESIIKSDPKYWLTLALLDLENSQ